jgi:L-rhamnose isomerase
MTATVKIGERALIGRINRRLRMKNEFWTLRKTRPGKAQLDLGNYYITDDNRNTVDAYHINNLVEWVKREYPGLLKPYEEVVF